MVTDYATQHLGLLPTLIATRAENVVAGTPIDPGAVGITAQTSGTAVLTLVGDSSPVTVYMERGFVYPWSVSLFTALGSTASGLVAFRK